ncbi:hypothetical protein CALCODRAFT_202282 [Calocera cornea HHB12733]|uniref:Uncharacterized protein n=1 Tax=Calocera cornea HHB12733 TaxID=1353952 RepID=A0A165JXZ0_9BASI|nr:hypothetical protein CALCODRAFT_202282 [Calocera cornea HHB12733]
MDVPAWSGQRPGVVLVGWVRLVIGRCSTDTFVRSGARGGHERQSSSVLSRGCWVFSSCVRILSGAGGSGAQGARRLASSLVVAALASSRAHSPPARGRFSTGSRSRSNMSSSCPNPALLPPLGPGPPADEAHAEPARDRVREGELAHPCVSAAHARVPPAPRAGRVRLAVAARGRVHPAAQAALAPAGRELARAQPGQRAVLPGHAHACVVRAARGGPHVQPGGEGRPGGGARRGDRGLLRWLEVQPAEPRRQALRERLARHVLRRHRVPGERHKPLRRIEGRPAPPAPVAHHALARLPAERGAVDQHVRVERAQALHGRAGERVVEEGRALVGRREERGRVVLLHHLAQARAGRRRGRRERGAVAPDPAQPVQVARGREAGGEPLERRARARPALPALPLLGREQVCQRARQEVLQVVVVHRGLVGALRPARADRAPFLYGDEAFSLAAAEAEAGPGERLAVERVAHEQPLVPVERRGAHRAQVARAVAVDRRSAGRELAADAGARRAGHGRGGALLHKVGAGGRADRAEAKVGPAHGHALARRGDDRCVLRDARAHGGDGEGARAGRAHALEPGWRAGERVACSATRGAPLCLHARREDALVRAWDGHGDARRAHRVAGDGAAARARAGGDAARLGVREVEVVRYAERKIRRAHGRGRDRRGDLHGGGLVRRCAGRLADPDRRPRGRHAGHGWIKVHCAVLIWLAGRRHRLVSHTVLRGGLTQRISTGRPAPITPPARPVPLAILIPLACTGRIPAAAGHRGAGAAPAAVAVRVCALGSLLRLLLVPAVHAHRLPGQDVGERALVPELALPFYEPARTHTPSSARV